MSVPFRLSGGLLAGYRIAGRAIDRAVVGSQLHSSRGFRSSSFVSTTTITTTSSSSTMAAPVPERRFKNPALFVCDIQEKFRPTIFELDKVILTTRKMLLSSLHLSIPIFVTTQNRTRLGDTVSELKPLLQQAADKGLLQADLDKTRFSMYLPAIASHPIFSSGKKAEVAIVGIESHICVTQSALDLLAAGHRVYIIADGVSSSNKEEVGIALQRLRQAGAIVTSSESWLYELMGDAAIPEFKGMVNVVKETMRDTRAALQGLLGSKI